MGEMAVVSLGALLIVGALWFQVCNELTYRQRGRLIKNRPPDSAFWAHSREWDAVPYDRHLWTLFTLRNPKRLYGPLSQQIWGGKRRGVS